MVYLLLFVTTLGAGIAPLFLPKVNSKAFHFALVFSGAYLFGITLMHLLPELYSGGVEATEVSLWILAGFFMQVLLDHYTSGVEHGHLHISDHDHHHKLSSLLVLLLAMGVHALLEGSLLAHPELGGHQHGDQHNDGLLIGIILHKMPAAFALMSLIMCGYKKLTWPVIFMVIFALATPAGMFLSEFLSHSVFANTKTMTIVFALVTGNFLHITTTIFFESNPGHKLRGTRLLVIILGTGLAVISEFLA